MFQNHTDDVRTVGLYILIFPFLDRICGNKISDEAAEMCRRLEDPVVSYHQGRRRESFKESVHFSEGMESNLRRQQSSEDYSFRQ